MQGIHDLCQKVREVDIVDISFSGRLLKLGEFFGANGLCYFSEICSNWSSRMSKGRGVQTASYRFLIAYCCDENTSEEGLAV